MIEWLINTTHLETVKKVIELLRWEVPCQLGQEVMDVLHNGLMLTSLQMQQPDSWVNKILLTSTTRHLSSVKYMLHLHCGQRAINSQILYFLQQLTFGLCWKASHALYHVLWLVVLLKTNVTNLDVNFNVILLYSRCEEVKTPVTLLV